MVMCPACLDKYMSEQSEEWCYFSPLLKREHISSLGVQTSSSPVNLFQIAGLLCPLLFT